MTLVGARIIDRWITPERTGTIVTVDPETMTVCVSWRDNGNSSPCSFDDIAAGRYAVIVPRPKGQHGSHPQTQGATHNQRRVTL